MKTSVRFLSAAGLLFAIAAYAQAPTITNEGNNSSNTCVRGFLITSAGGGIIKLCQYQNPDGTFVNQYIRLDAQGGVVQKFEDLNVTHAATRTETWTEWGFNGGRGYSVQHGHWQGNGRGGAIFEYGTNDGGGTTQE
jgi:hypothetical protein